MIDSNLTFSKEEIQAETDRLLEKMKIHKWTREECTNIAPLTLEINKLKKEKNAVVLAHSYQTAQIIFGIGDFVGD
ncbi:MAG: quinolinate synthase NadA, partial [Candidatus Hermodarchaeota archaeon]